MLNGLELRLQYLTQVVEREAAHLQQTNRAAFYERLGWVDNVAEWLEARGLHNQMVHEYIQDIEQLTNALMRGKELVPMLIQTQQKLSDFYSTTQTDKTI